MLRRVAALVAEVKTESLDAIQIVTEYGPAIAYRALVGQVQVGDRVILNRTANVLKLGTGGYDFVMAVVDGRILDEDLENGHIIKVRYTPSQLAVTTLEEYPDLASIWEKGLEGVPVVVCQLHSQIAHAAAAVTSLGKKAVYVMTDSGSLAAPISRLLGELRATDIITASITTGQAFGGDYETVTVHSALLAARHYLDADVVIVGQGPGNAGTGTKYGFGGIEQAGLLDVVAALGGNPIAAVRASTEDPRPRHRGISHHTLTSLTLVRSACTIPVPAGMICEGIEPRHRIVEMPDQSSAFDLLDRLQIAVTTMGRGTDSDRIFFEASAAAGRFAAEIGDE